jgi:PTS system nitrogen regulatory IIA component
MDPLDPCPLATLLQQCGVLYGVPGDDKTSVLTTIVERLNLPDGVDRDQVIGELLRREDIASTGIGQGVALPHPQSAAALHMPESMVALVFLEHPIEYDAPDAVPVQALFVILSRDTGQHLRLLAHLGRILQQAEAMEALAHHLPVEELLPVLRRVENDIHARLAARGRP